MKEEIKFLKEHLKPISTVVVACSGGPDSMCLLNLVNSLKSEMNLKVICAHVNHLIRKEAAKEAKMVQKYALENGDIFELLEITDYKTEKFSESDARKRRYQFFKEVAHKYHADAILTAHHGDDLIETILMRITRGSNLNGYIGIKQISEDADLKLIRPLLTVSKNDILKYVNEQKIPYAIDSSNDNLKYTRNRYRHNVLPFLHQELPNVEQKYLKFSKELQDYDNFVTDYIRNKKLIVDNIVDINKLKEENEFIVRKCIEIMVKTIQKKDILDISDKQIMSIMDLVYHNRKMIDLNNSYQAINEYGMLKIVKKENKKFRKMIIDKDISINNMHFYYNNSDANDSNNCILLSKKDIKLPLKLRTWNKGDKMTVKNLSGTKKVSDIFINSKVPSYKRDSFPILVDSNDEILWLPSVKKSQFAKDKSEKYDIIIKCEAR